MVTALDTYLPFASGAGSNVTEDQWRDLAEQWFPTGIVHGYANAFATTQRAAGANMSVDVDTGQARVRGHEGISTAIKNLAVTANPSGNPRIDTVVLRGDFVNDTIGLDVLAGTAAVNPVPPALTQNTSTWEVPLYDVFVSAGAASIATADLRDRRPFVFQVAQIASKEPVRLATAAAMAASTVVGTVRTANANGAMANIDGVAPAVGDRILDKDNATGANRGIWRITDLGSASQPWRMERPPDFDASADVRDGTRTTVGEGTANAGTGWMLTTNDPITLGTTALTFTQFPGPSGAFLLACTSYKPVGITDTSTANTTPTDVDAANLVVAFTAPASGAVLVRLTAAAFVGTATWTTIWSLADSGGTDVTDSDCGATSLTGTAAASRAVKITGLTPGGSYTWKWRQRLQNASGTAAHTVYGGLWGPAVMEVWTA